MLNDVGADPKILNALKKARVSDSAGQAGSRSSSELLNHLATAGKLLRNKKYEDAERELTDSLQSGEGLEAGFVMARSSCGLRETIAWQRRSTAKFCVEIRIFPKHTPS